MDDFKVVYTLSATRDFMYQMNRSLTSLNRWVDKENIISIVNPPSDNYRIKNLNKLSTVYQGNPKYGKISKSTYFNNFNAMYKLEMCDIESENLIFIDCDTIVLRDITELLDGDFDFSAREEPCRSINGIMKKDWNQDAWVESLKLLDLPLSSLPFNDGLMVFKNRTHIKIRDDILDFYNRYHAKELPYPMPDFPIHDNEFALSLAVAKYKVRYMGENEHWYGWRKEFISTKLPPYVIHFGTGNRHNLSEIIKRYKPYEQYLTHYLGKDIEGLPTDIESILSDAKKFMYAILKRTEPRNRGHRCAERLGIKQGDVVVDAGAWVGNTTYAFLDTLKDTGKIISIECNKDSYYLFNQIFDRVKNVISVNKAVWSSPGYEKLYLDTGHSRTQAFSLMEDIKDIDNRRYYDMVECDTLDNILKDLSIDKVDHIKLNIEGAEMEALKGMSNILKSKPNLYIYCHVINGIPTSKEIIDTLSKLGYTCEQFPKIGPEDVVLARYNE